MCNYARIFPWWQTARTVDEAIGNALQQLDNGIAVSSMDHTGSRVKDDKERANANSRGDAFGVANYCGLTIDNAMLAYLKWKKISSEAWIQMLVAAGVANFVQWGTTGTAILIACR